MKIKKNQNKLVIDFEEQVIVEDSTTIFKKDFPELNELFEKLDSKKLDVELIIKNLIFENSGGEDFYIAKHWNVMVVDGHVYAVSPKQVEKDTNNKVVLLWCEISFTDSISTYRDTFILEPVYLPTTATID